MLSLDGEEVRIVEVIVLDKGDGGLGAFGFYVGIGHISDLAFVSYLPILADRSLGAKVEYKPQNETEESLPN